MKQLVQSTLFALFRSILSTNDSKENRHVDRFEEQGMRGEEGMIGRCEG